MAKVGAHLVYRQPLIGTYPGYSKPTIRIQQLCHVHLTTSSPTTYHIDPN